MCLTLLSFSSALAIEQKSQESNEPELKFLKGVSKYQGNNGPTKVLRPLKEFKVGKKYCLWGTDKWDEACQDAVMKYAFGEEWREFKRVIIEFLEAHKQNDPVVLSRLFKYPLNVAVASRLHSDGTYGYSWHEVDDADDAVRYFSHVIEWPLSNGIARELYQIKHQDLDQYELYTSNHFNDGQESDYDYILRSPDYKKSYSERPRELFLRDAFTETSYEKILINDSWQGGYYVITLKKGISITFKIINYEEGKEKNCRYNPLIEAIMY